MKSRLAILPVILLTLAPATVPAMAGAATSAPAGYLKPDLKVGEQLTHVFSKAVSIEGDGFVEYVKRISGTGHETVVAVDATAIIFDATYRYDGRPSATATGKSLADGVTDCWDGKCSVNLSTSGKLFNHALWGDIPDSIRVGTTWTARLTQPWELGPAGTETVRVASLDPRSRQITLTREGSGSGFSSDDRLRGQRIAITTTQGERVEVAVVPGKTTWSGYTTVRKGVIVGDTIMVRRHVTLVSASGRKFEGEQRSYTLENLLRDGT